MRNEKSSTGTPGFTRWSHGEVRRPPRHVTIPTAIAELVLLGVTPSSVSVIGPVEVGEGPEPGGTPGFLGGWLGGGRMLTSPGPTGQALVFLSQPFSAANHGCAGVGRDNPHVETGEADRQLPGTARAIEDASV